MKTILNGITKENALFILMLGMCPALAVTNKFENAYIFGICLSLVLIASTIIISLFKKWIKGSIQIPMYILVIGIFVTLTEVFLQSYVPSLYKVFGIYLSLIVVNCIVLGRVLQVASKQKLKFSILDAIGIGVGYTISLGIIGFIREVIGTGTITIMDSISTLTGYRAVYQLYPDTTLFPMNIFITPAGAFLVLGLILGIINMFKRREKHESN